MSDTTITPEVRQNLRMVIGYAMDGEQKIIPLPWQSVQALLDALEHTETKNVQLQQRVNELLSEELTDGAVRERIQLRFGMHEVLQQNERLTKMVDWLAGRELTVDGFAAPCQCENEYFQGKKAPCGEKPDEFCSKFNHRGNGACWKEAARRAVAAGEE